MPSSATSSLRLQKIATGEKLNTWGSELNSSVFELLEDAIAGWEAHTITGDKTLTSTNYTTDQARMAMLEFNGSPSAAFEITIPAAPKWYFVKNSSGQQATITAGGVGAIAYDGEVVAILCDGTDCYRTESNTFGQDVSMGSNKIKDLADPTADQHAATKKYVDDENTSQSAAITASQAAAAASASAAATSASNASDSETAAAASETAAAASETAAAASETAAGTSETNAAASETAAASSASAASSSASAASTSATSAASSASAASTSETNAATSETNAASSASAASTSASSASSAQTAAEAAQTAAEAAQASTEAVLDSFDDRYLGSKATAPTVDNDGDPLAEGMLYWNSTTNILNIYNGSSWVPFGSGTMSAQDADNVAITGGSIDGVAIGGSTPAAGAFTTLSATGVTSLASGVVAAPSLTMGTSTTGLYQATASQWRFAVGGADSIILSEEYVRVRDGSASIPSFAFIDDGNSGLYSIANGIIGVSCNGVDALQISSAYTRAVSGSVSVPGFSFIGDGDTGIYNPSANVLGLVVGGVDSVYATANGVGINTNAPARTFHVYSNGPRPILLETNNTNAFFMLKSVDQDQDVYFGSTGTRMVFGTNGTERMCVTDAGRLGIGTTAPSFTLHAANTTADTVAFFQGATTGARVTIARGTSFTWDVGLDSSSKFFIETGSADRALTIDPSTRYVGIGTDSPSTALDVDGTTTTGSLALGASGDLALGAGHTITLPTTEPSFPAASSKVTMWLDTSLNELRFFANIGGSNYEGSVVLAAP